MFCFIFSPLVPSFLCVHIFFLIQMPFLQAKMNDSSELLQAILESLHESFDTVNCDFQSQDEYEGSLDCSSAGCFVHIIFGMDHYEKVNCVKCSAKFGYRKNTTLFLTLNAYNLRNMKVPS